MSLFIGETNLKNKINQEFHSDLRLTGSQEVKLNKISKFDRRNRNKEIQFLIEKRFKELGKKKLGLSK